MPVTGLHQLLDASATRDPTQTAVEATDGRSLTYSELAHQSDQLRNWLVQQGVQRGDRVGLCLPKSLAAVVAIYGSLKCGAAYVPIDPSAPAARSAGILQDCAVSVVIVEASLAAALLEQGVTAPLIRIETGAERPFQPLFQSHPPAAPTVTVAAADLAYILYTSGSTGRPKGVILTHENALSFIEWCAAAFDISAQDRFSSHAPFHFDLSILDLYLSVKVGATLVLIGAEVGRNPRQLAKLMADKRLSVWYSTPAILSLLIRHGKMARYDYSALRIILFAGEVFPIPPLRALKERLPGPRYFNLYGPTETNVCTYFEIPDTIPDNQTTPFPIGRLCTHCEGLIVDTNDKPVATGAEGELCISGPGVMAGYWQRSDRTKAVFLAGADGRRWYRTGDIVIEGPTGNLDYVGRRDRMVKRRGFRVELGEIEAALYRHPAVIEAAAIAHNDAAEGVRIQAFLACKSEGVPSLIQWKRFCAETLPSYMAPDQFTSLPTLPKTSTDKIDYQALQNWE